MEFVVLVGVNTSSWKDFKILRVEGMWSSNKCIFFYPLGAHHTMVG